jgi:hypothetical protein
LTEGATVGTAGGSAGTAGGSGGSAPRAGTAGTPLHVKLGIGDGDEVALVGAPAWLEDSIGERPEVASLHTDLADDARYDVIVAFVTQRAELEAELPRMRARMAPACGLWIAWPKRASKMPTDITDNVVRDIALPTGLVDNKVCAIGQTWSGLRLVIRRELRLLSATPPPARLRRLRIPLARPAQPPRRRDSGHRDGPG